MTLEDPEMLNRRIGDKGIAPSDSPYIHYSPPRLLDTRKWARGGDVDRLREVALGGHAHRLLGLAAPGVKTRAFLRDLPKLISKCENLHLAATEGSLQDIKDILEKDPMRKRLAMCRDRAGVGLLHKAVYYDYKDIITYLLDNYPQTAYMRDSEGRTPLHYAAVCSDANAVAEEIINAGAERNPLDSKQRLPSYYMTRPTALRLPVPPPPTPQQTELVIKPSNIRIWCHDRDLGRLQQVVWKGQGTRLRTEVSNQPAVKRFLEAVPHIMVTIREIHTAVVNNDLQKLKNVTDDPIPPIVLSSQDLNGMTALHKAAGLGNYEIAEYILTKYPEGTQIVDNDGRTPLHWSILAKDKDKIYNLLMKQGAKESALDHKLKTGAFYKNRPTDLDKSLLHVIPEAPRVASPTYPSSWDWELLKADAQTIMNHFPRTRKHADEKESLQKSDSVQSFSEQDNVEMKSSHLDSSEMPNNESQEDEEEEEREPEENGDKGYEAEQEDHMDDELNQNENDENHVDIDGNTVETNGEAEKSPTPENDHDSSNIDDTSNRPDSAHSTKSDQTLDNAHNVDNAPTESPEHELQNENVSKLSSAVSRKSSARSLKSMSAKSRASYKVSTQQEEEEANADDLKVDNKEDETNVSEKEDNGENNEENNDETNEEQNNNTEEEKEEETVEDGTNKVESQESKEQSSLNNESNQTEENEEEEESVSQSEDNSNELGPRVQDDDKEDEDGDLQTIHEHLAKSRPVSSKSIKSTKSRKFSTARSTNYIEAEKSNRDKNHTGRSQGSESTIEGVVNADAEVDSFDADQRILSRNTPEEGDVNIDDAEVQTLIDSGNMEQLASLVLNGEGERLVGHMAKNPDLQAFLDNVPSYMNKIKRVHLSARDGSIRELQAALDRRKFAVARDQVSPHGATPLHVAVLFGHTPIVRYLAGRFPETLSAVDFEGRTALHYAAVLKDNEHYYNILLNMGANPKDQDDNGYNPEDYQRDDKHLTHQQLLNDFGADETLAETMLSDKVANDTVSSRRELADPDMQSVLWRCFRLLQDHRRPSKTGAPPSASTNQGSPTTFLGRFLTRNVFEKVKETSITAAATNDGGHNGQVDVPLFRTEEGKYLALALGDPLIKGLTEVANMRPKDPIAFLATYLYNFANQNKSRVGTQESETLIRSDAPPIEATPAQAPSMPMVQTEELLNINPAVQAAISAPPTPSGPEVAFSSDNRDEHGQSMLHFAAARGHARGALMQLIREAGVSLSFRDELYRTARDVSIQANMPNNTKELDMWTLEVAARGDLDKMKELLVNGYDHILDVEDEDGVSIADIVSQRGLTDISDLLALIPEFEDTRERLHQSIRQDDEAAVHEILNAAQRTDPIQNLLSGKSMASAKNSFGRCALHIAVLGQKEELVEYIAKKFPETLRIGDNLERTALHYAMGVDNVESTSRVLIKAGAKRVLKDLKGRQPSYYFMNKSDILRLKEEEEAY